MVLGGNIVFLEMGGHPSNLEVLLLHNTASRNSTNSFAQVIEFFDPRRATSTMEYDTIRLRQVIDASGQGMQGIKRVVKEAFVPND